ncbi:MAG: PilZ domain-containing protein [Planctomycetota bacterium]
MDDGKGNTGRRHGRVGVRRQVRVLVQYAGDWVPVTAQAGDLSLGGCSIRLLDPLDSDLAVIASFPSFTDEDEHLVYGVVRHCTYDASDWVKVGIEFRDPPSDLDLSQVLSRAFPEAA